MRLARHLKQFIFGKVESPPLQPLLQTGFRIAQIFERRQIIQSVAKYALDNGYRCVEAGVQVNRTKQGLERIGENRPTCVPAGLPLAASQYQVISQADSLRQIRQRRVFYQRCSKFAQIAFRGLGVRPIDNF